MLNPSWTSDAAASIEGRVLTITRAFRAPRELVFETWTDPRHLARWWGPQDFTLTTRSHEFAVGGVWDYMMHGPDGTDYPNRIEYVDIVRPERIEYRHGDDESPERFRVVVTMADVGGATEVTMKMAFPTAEELEFTVKTYGAVEGAKQTFSRLANEVETLLETSLLLARTFDAPRDAVFEAWTNANHLKRWWGPQGFEISVSAFDLRPGGAFHYRMSDPEGFEMWGKFVFRDISAPERLVFVNSFSDPEGRVTRAPFDGHEHFPLEVLYIATFEEADGRTKLTLRGGPIGATEEELRFFRSMHPSMQQGFGGTFDRLDAYLAGR